MSSPQVQTRVISTDEPFDRFVSRPVSAVLMRPLKNTKVTPNMVTFVAAVFGVAAGVFLWLRQGPAAAACVALYVILDCADGQLARLKGTGGSPEGRAVDGLGDYLTGIAIHGGLIAWITHLHGLVWGIALGIGAGLSMAWHSFLFDRYKRRYSGNHDDLEAMRRDCKEVGGFKGWMIRQMTPYCERLYADATVPDQAAYQQRIGRLMYLWLLNGPTTHFTVMIVLFALSLPTEYAIACVGPFNALAVITLGLQKRLESRPPPVVEPAVEG